MKFFDSLVHVTDDGSWLGGRRYDASLDRLLLEMDRGQVAKACLVAIAEHAENETVARVAAHHPDRFVPVGSINPGAISREAVVGQAVERLREEGFRGLKLHPRLNGYDPLDPRCIAAINAAGQVGLVVFLDTLYRQRSGPTRHAADVVDHIANACTGTRIVLLHGGGSALLDMFEMVRMHAHLLLDVSFTVLRYAGSSLDQDIRFLCKTLDQRLVVGSDFPEYTPGEAFGRLMELAEGVPRDKVECIVFGNLDALFP